MAAGFDVDQRGAERATWSWSPGAIGALRGLLVAAAWLTATACGFYSADEITATVVDADTKAPIEGVNVVAEWAIRGGINYGSIVGYMNVIETVTDKEGKFHFPSWGPRPNFHLGEIRQSAPALMLFKNGYRYTSMENNGNSLDAAPSKTKSDWNGQIIAMARYAGPTPDYDAGFIALTTDTDNLQRLGHWDNVPRFLCALGQEGSTLSAHGIRNSLPSLKSLHDAGVNCHFARAER